MGRPSTEPSIPYPTVALSCASPIPHPSVASPIPKCASSDVNGGNKRDKRVEGGARWWWGGGDPRLPKAKVRKNAIFTKNFKICGEIRLYIFGQSFSI